MSESMMAGDNVGLHLAPDGWAWLGKKRDLTLYLMTVKEDGHDQPALYIRNANRRVDSPDPVTGEMKPGSPGVIIRLSDFWIFRPEDTDRGRTRDIAEMVWKLNNYCEHLYGVVVPSYVNRIHDCILEFVDDVKNMRPPPELTREQWLAGMAKAGVTLKVNGQAVN
jgi:hypothetical protein